MNDTYNWYSKLKKPAWAPPSWLFGPVWTVLYAIIVVTYGYVFYEIVIGNYPLSIGIPFILNLIFNFIFTPLQFGLRNNLLATIDILLVLFTIIWIMITIWLKVPWIVYANIPYLLWVSFATVLQLNITYRNRE